MDHTISTSSSRPLAGPPRRKAGKLAEYTEDIQAAGLEFAGTVLFLLIGLGGIQAVSEANGSSEFRSNVLTVLYISAVMGLSLLVSAWMFFRVTGGLFNPNVSFALLLTGIITPVRFVLYTIAQLVGAIVAAGLVLGLTNGPLASNTFLGTGMNSAQGVFIEMFITAALCMTVLMLGAEKHQATPFAPVGVGLTLFACHMWAVFYTGAAMNSARSFGPAAVTSFKYGKHWVYWVGPTLGAMLAAAFYRILKHFRYWRLNPGQDSTDIEDTPGAAPTAAEVEAGMANGGVDGRGGSSSRTAGQPLEKQRPMSD